MEFDIIKLAIVGVFAVVWYLLKQKDAQQEASIKDLYDKHSADVEKLRDLEVRLAKDHYVKTELDARFDRLESTFRDGFKALGDRFDRLSNVLLAHTAKDE